MAMPEIHKATNEVKDEVDKYTTIINSIVTAMQFKNENEKQDENILEWIYPTREGYVTPKPSDKVGDTCQLFLNSDAYLNWVGGGPSTLICTGQRTLVYYEPLILM